MIRKLFLLLFLLGSLAIYAEESRKMELASYLRPQLIGKRIDVKLNGKGRRVSLKIVNIVYHQDAYYAVLSNSHYVAIHFSTLYMKPRLTVNDSNAQEHLQLQGLKVQESLNNILKTTLSESSTPQVNSTLKNIEEKADLYFTKNYFTTSKKIIYTDTRKKEEMSDYFIVSSTGLYLKNGVYIGAGVDSGTFEKD